MIVKTEPALKYVQYRLVGDIQGEHFKLSRSLRYQYSPTIILTKNLKTVLELWEKELQKQL